ncbi:methionyl-tRNA formyltransferase: mitochondrial-like protein, partial [Dinothrombium tinctorium]
CSRKVTFVYLQSFRNKSNLSVLFYGSDSCSLQSLKALHSNSFEFEHERVVENVSVVSGSENNVVSKYAKSNNLRFHLWPFEFQPHAFDIGVVASFGKLIPLQAIENCTHGMINVHASLLPRWRGAAPIQAAILNGDTVTGVTLMKIAPHKFDVGECILQEAIQMHPRITAQELHPILASLGAKLLIQCLKDLDYYLSNAKKQPSEGITLSKKIKKEDGLIVWDKMTSDEVDKRFRALNSFFDVYTYWIDGLKLKLCDVVDPKLAEEAQIDTLLAGQFKPEQILPGFIFFHKKRRQLFIKCCDNKWIAFESIWPTGKKQKINASSFYSGYMRRVNKNTPIILRDQSNKENVN